MTLRPENFLRGWRRAPVAGLLLAAWLAVAPAAAQPSKEYDLKAVFLLNFASFVEWPDGAQPAPGEPFLIGVLGDDPFGRSLTDVIAGERVRGAPLKVIHSRKLEDLRHCQILFVSNSEAARWSSIISRLRSRPILTVGDDPRFVESGGMVAFYTGARVQLVADAGRAAAAGLTIRSKLLRVAKSREALP
jgi:hypothetical protein